MADTTIELEAALDAHAEKSETGKLLQSSWRFDKLLLTDSLQAVGVLFPHYSRHDASHSRRIASNIAQILGERVKQLGPTDLWLLLEAAHWHDVGMIVDDDSAREWWQQPDFREHLERLREGKDTRLQQAARDVLGGSDEALRKTYGKHWQLELRRSIAFVLADYARGRHASRSSEIVLEPSRASIGSPRGLIPTRLFRWLAQIALVHGCDAATAMETLAHRENGVGTDVCHPRFAGFMLRLGDLLDLDNGRFCASLARTIGELPPSSVQHVGKHAAITRFLLSPEKIEVHAVCNDYHDPSLHHHGISAYDVYEATESWLGWLRDELAFLNQWWSDIAPPGFSGAPGYGAISARLDGYELRDGHSPRFGVDADTLFQLVAGKNLYAQPTSTWLRELLANAKDATLCRAWHEQVQEHSSEELASAAWRAKSDPIAEMMRLLGSRFSIEVSLSPVPEPDCGGEDAARASSRASGQRAKSSAHFSKHAKPTSRWRFSIRDQGVGIGPKDLEYLLTVGASSKRRRRFPQPTSMPPYWEPTGSFGIGLQSVFQVTDRIVIRTHHFESHECREIVLNNPAPFPPGVSSTVPRAWGAAYIRRLKEHEVAIHRLYSPGTVVEFDIDLNHLPPFETEHFQGSGEKPFSDVRDRAFFDFVSVPQPALWPALWWSLLCKWRVGEEYLPKLVSTAFKAPTDSASNPPRAETEVFFHGETAIRFRFGLIDGEATRTDGGSGSGMPLGSQPRRFAYQGVDFLAFPRTESLRERIRELLPNFPWEKIGIEIEWFEGPAWKYLNIDRDRLTPEGERRLCEALKRALNGVMPKYLEALERHRPADESTQLISLYVQLYCDGVEPSQLLKNVAWRWLKFDWLLVDGLEQQPLGSIVPVPAVYTTSSPVGDGAAPQAPNKPFHLSIDRHKELDPERMPGVGQSALSCALQLQLFPKNPDARELRVKRAFGTKEQWKANKERFRRQFDWFDDFILKHFAAKKLGTTKSRAPEGDGEDFVTTQYDLTPRPVMQWSQPPAADEVEEDAGFWQELALIFGRTPRVRAALPSHPDYRGLEVGHAICKEKAWIAEGSHILRPSFVCPFELYGLSIELEHVEEYVQWVAQVRRERDEALRVLSQSEVETEVARVTWQFVCDVDKLMTDATTHNLFAEIKRAYNTQDVKRRLENFFSLRLDDEPQPAGRKERKEALRKEKERRSRAST
ncbi:MAG TPA: hypothetical protein VFQ35_07265 [Polyangiaceae bacterium]|nr:hypothetical protein [Polyangiaceae bacterium]